MSDTDDSVPTPLNMTGLAAWLPTGITQEQLTFDIDKAWGDPPPKCECGSDKTYGEGNGMHMTYCPLYVKP